MILPMTWIDFRAMRLNRSPLGNERYGLLSGRIGGTMYSTSSMGSTLSTFSSSSMGSTSSDSSTSTEGLYSSDGSSSGSLLSDGKGAPSSEGSD